MATASFQASLQQLTQACQAFNTGMGASRQEAEQVMLAFRRSENVLGCCRFIMEHSRDQFVLFQVAASIKEGVVREYAIRPRSEMEDLKNFTMNYVLHHPELEGYVRQQFLRALAVIIKREWLDYSEQERHAVLGSIAQLLQMEGFGKQLAIPFCVAIMNEFSSRKSSAVGLTWDFHFQSRASFEKFGLKQIFEAVLVTMQTILRKGGYPHNNPEDLQIFKACLTAFETIFGWEFATGGGDFAGSFKQQQVGWNPQPTERFPKDWASLIVTVDFLDLFFHLLEMVHGKEEDLSHRVMQCLIQLAGIHGPIFSEEGSRKAYAGHLLKHLARIMKMQNLEESLRLGACQMLRRLIETFRISILATLPEFSETLSHAAYLTSSSIVAAIKDDADETWNMEAFDELLEAWTSLLNQLNAQMESSAASAVFDMEQYRKILTEVGYHVFETYVNARVSFDNDSLEDDLIIEMKDQDIYDDQLLSISHLARLQGYRAVAFLDRLLKERSHTLQEGIIKFKSGQIPETFLHTLHDHIHWILLIAGYLVSDSGGTGEKALVPTAFLQALPPGDGNPLVSLVNSALALAELISGHSSSSDIDIMSPLVTETLFWFLERWSRCYLLCDTNSEYTNLPTTLVEAFGQNSPHAHRIVEFILDRIQTNSILWSGEVEVTLSMVKLLDSFSRDPGIRTLLMHMPKWSWLVNFFVQHFSALPGETHSSLMCALAAVGSGAKNDQEKQAYFQSILAMVDKQFWEVTRSNGQPNGPPAYSQSPEALMHVQDVLDMFSGLASALDPVSNQTYLFPFCARYFEEFVKLLQAYSAVPEISIYILEFWMRFVERLGIYKLSEPERQVLFHGCINVLKVYANNNFGKNYKAEDQENVLYDDMYTILKILSNLIASDFDGYFDGTGGGQPAAGGMQVIDVVLFGINLVIPLITPKMMQTPKMTMEYMKLVNNVMELYPEKLTEGLPVELFQSLMRSIAFGLEHGEFEISRLAFDAVTALAKQELAQRRKKGGVASGGPLSSALDVFLQQILEVLFFKEYDSDLVESVASQTTLAVMQARPESIVPALEKVMQHAASLLAQQPSGSAMQGHLQHAVTGTFWQEVSPLFSTADPSVQQQRGAGAAWKQQKKSREQVFSTSLLRVLSTVRGMVRVK